MKIAVHLHFYYLDQLPDILRYLHSLDDQKYDLFVTMNKHDEEVEKAIKRLNSKTTFMIVPNMGYDIGPFIEFLHKVDLDGYDYILKIHTKAYVSKNYALLNKKRLDNRLWRRILLEALLKDKTRVQDNLKILEDNPNIGMLASKYCVTNEKRIYQKLLPQVNDILKACGFNEVNTIHFVAGTMFYVRARLLKPLLKYTIKDFAQTDEDIKEGTFAHVAERLFGALVEAQGYVVHGIEHDNYTKEFILTALKYFVFQKKETKRRVLIKVFRIPVYAKKKPK